jgi:hypothetical protein
MPCRQVVRSTLTCAAVVYGATWRRCALSFEGVVLCGLQRVDGLAFYSGNGPEPEVSHDLLPQGTSFLLNAEPKLLAELEVRQPLQAHRRAKRAPMCSNAFVSLLRT